MDRPADADTDRAVLEGMAERVGIDPDSPMCPDCADIASRDTKLSEKVDTFNTQLQEKLRSRREARRRRLD